MTYVIHLGNGETVKFDEAPEDVREAVLRMDAAIKAGQEPDGWDIMSPALWSDEQEKKYPTITPASIVNPELYARAEAWLDSLTGTEISLRDIRRHALGEVIDDELAKRLARAFIHMGKLRELPHGYRGTTQADKGRAELRLAITRGEIPRARELPCADCGRWWTPAGPRHEYHHHRGYERENALDVVALCQPCHGAREREERSVDPSRRRGPRYMIVRDLFPSLGI